MAKAKKPEPKKPMGRPRAVIDWSEVDELLEAQLNGEEIAESLGIHADTLYDAVERDFKTTFSA
jgi:hypothetical protein